MRSSTAKRARFDRLRAQMEVSYQSAGSALRAGIAPGAYGGFAGENNQCTNY